MPSLDRQALADRLVAGDAGNTAEKGAALEAVVTHTLCLMEGVGIIATNIVDDAETMEVDILLYNLRHPQGLPFLPDNIMIECKNWRHPVDTAAVRVFISKLRSCRLDLGILVAANGVTGDPSELSSAFAHIRSEFDRSGIKLLVVTREELESLTTTEGLGLLLRRKFGACIMGLAQV
jgi:hypothetical protein